MALIIRWRRGESPMHPLHGWLWPLYYMCLILLLVYQLRAVLIIHFKLWLRLKH